MFIECVNNNGTDYLRMVEGYSYSKDGLLKHKRRVIRNIGPLARFDDGKPDFLKRLRQSFKNRTPLIDSLADLLTYTPIKRKLIIEFDLDNDTDCFFSPKNLGYFLLDGLYDALGIYDVLNLYKSRKRLDYDLNGNAKLLVFGRALFPNSKFGTFEDKDRYLFNVTKSEKVTDVYYTLDGLNNRSDAIMRRMNLKIRQKIGRDTEFCFYDVTNYWFEIGENDLDKVDENGNVTQKGLRKRGVSKENRRDPLVQMGLFIDSNGIPIAYRLFSGNETDQTTLRPALEKTIDKMDFGKIIIVTDGGLNSGTNIGDILDKGNGYIVSKSTKKSDKTVKAWILKEEGYQWNNTHTFKVKSQIRKRKVEFPDGTLREISEKLVCFWSKNHYERERNENEKFIEYLNSVIANPNKLKDKPKKIEKFLKKTIIDKKTGEPVNATITLSIDMVKVQEYLDLMGYYTIMTSEIDKNEQEIIEKYHGLSRIEDSFRITKSNLEGRPVFVRTREHINAHFLTCFIALTMIRLIQYIILKFQDKDANNVNSANNTNNDNNTSGWKSGLSAEKIQTALCNWQADVLPSGYYRMSKPDDNLRLILRAFDINDRLILPTETELRKLKLSIDEFVM